MLPSGILRAQTLFGQILTVFQLKVINNLIQLAECSVLKTYNNSVPVSKAIPIQKLNKFLKT